MIIYHTGNRWQECIVILTKVNIIKINDHKSGRRIEHGYGFRGVMLAITGSNLYCY